MMYGIISFLQDFYLVSSSSANFSLQDLLKNSW